MWLTDLLQGESAFHLVPLGQKPTLQDQCHQPGIPDLISRETWTALQLCNKNMLGNPLLPLLHRLPSCWIS